MGRNHLIALWCSTHALAALPVGAQQPVPSRSLAEEWRIPAEGERYMFSYVNGLVMAPNGDIHVLATPERTVFVFDGRSGAYQRTIGRHGDGPGEFAWPVSIGLLGDSVWVGDGTHRRVTLVSQTGGLIRTINVPRPGEPYVLRSGTLITIPGVRPRIGGVQHRLQIERHGAQGAARGTIVDTTVPMKVLGIDVGGTQFLARQPFDDSPLWAIARDGSGVVLIDRAIATGTRGTLRVLRINEHSSVTYDVQLPYAAQPLPESLVAKRSAEIAELVRARNQAIPPALARDWVREALFIPRYRPSATAVHAAHDGTVWLRREEPESGTVLWTVLDRMGRIQYDVRVPANATVHWVDGDTVLASVADVGELPEVIRYRLR